MKSTFSPALVNGFLYTMHPISLSPAFMDLSSIKHEGGSTVSSRIDFGTGLRGGFKISHSTLKSALMQLKAASVAPADVSLQFCLDYSSGSCISCCSPSGKLLRSDILLIYHLIMFCDWLTKMQRIILEAFAYVFKFVLICFIFVYSLKLKLIYKIR